MSSPVERKRTAVQADPLTDPQALTALTTYRPLEQAIAEDWGVQVEHVDHNAPFRLIQCPLCDGTRFVSVGFAGVWCDRCQAEFHVRHTAGDPGFVVDCTFAHYKPAAARQCSSERCRTPLYQFTRRRSPSQERGSFKLYADRERAILQAIASPSPALPVSMSPRLPVPLSPALRHGYGKVPLSEYIKKRAKGKLDLLIVDECHQYPCLVHAAVCGNRRWLNCAGERPLSPSTPGWQTVRWLYRPVRLRSG